MLKTFDNKEKNNKGLDSESLQMHANRDKDISETVIDTEISVLEIDLAELESEEYVNQLKEHCKEQGFSKDKYVEKLRRACDRARELKSRPIRELE